MPLFFMQVPLAHFIGESTEHPDSAGHFIDIGKQEPSGHLLLLLSLQDKLFLLHFLYINYLIHLFDLILIQYYRIF